MQDPPFLRLETPDANELAELLLIARDITNSIHAMELWYKKYADVENAKDREEEIIGGCLFRDSVVQFMACFDGTAQVRLKRDEVYQDEDGGRAYFDWLKGVRDAYAAHRFGAYRQSGVGAVMHPEMSGARTLGEFLFTYNGPQGEHRAQMIPFMVRAAKYLEGRINPLKKKIAVALESMTAEELASLKRLEFQAVHPSQARKSRRSLQEDRGFVPKIDHPSKPD